MRSPTDTCLLCQDNLADKKNSHIIPKFFAKGLFEGVKPRHTLLIGKENYKRKRQDTIKENHLFCAECESKFEILETYMSFRLNKIGDRKRLDNYVTFRRGDFKYYESLKIIPEISQLFWYSILWRVSISEHEMFLNLKLDKDIEDGVRGILAQNMQSTQSDLKSYLDAKKIDFKYPFVLIRPQKFIRPPRSLMAATNMGAGIYWINLVDYLLIFYRNIELVDSTHLDIANLGVDKFRVGGSSNKVWTDFNQILLRKVAQAHFD